jgi:hypothetical protein
MRRRAAFFPIALALGAIILVLACSGAVSAQAQETRNTRFPTPFKHVVVIFLLVESTKVLSSSSAAIPLI